MNTSIGKYFLFSVVWSSLFACSSAPKEEFTDYFYTYLSEDNKKQFTYILYLGEEGGPGFDLREDNISEIQSGRQPNSRQTQTRRRSSSAKGEDLVSISFRMEEESFKRLEKMLSTNQYCKGEPKYQSNEYTWLRYIIKGYCL